MSTAWSEAKELFELVQRGEETPERLRETIEISPKTEAVLLSYAAENPKEAAQVRQVIQYRKNVLAAFNRLVAQAAQIAPDSLGQSSQVGELVEEGSNGLQVPLRT